MEGETSKQSVLLRQTTPRIINKLPTLQIQESSLQNPSEHELQAHKSSPKRNKLCALPSVPHKPWYGWEQPRATGAVCLPPAAAPPLGTWPGFHGPQYVEPNL